MRLVSIMGYDLPHDVRKLNAEEELDYLIYDEKTESTMGINDLDVLNEYGIGLNNVRLKKEDGKVVIYNVDDELGMLRSYGVSEFERYRMIENVDGVYKAINIEADFVQYVNEKDLESFKEFCSNYDCIREEYIGVEYIKTDNEFKREIDEEYEKYLKKMKVLGLDNSFKYKVEGKDVKLEEYTGSSNKVIIPNFITTICKEAFYRKNIKEVKMGNGVKHIGQRAFYKNNIESLELPNSLEYMFMSALHKNTNLITKGELNKDRVKIDDSKCIFKRKGEILWRLKDYTTKR